ncbi:MAG: RNA polymerase sigma factor [Acidobacteriota bacterium]
MPSCTIQIINSQARERTPSGMSVESNNLDLSEIYQKYRPMVVRACQKVVGSQDLAEDIAQDVFAILITKLHTYQGKSSLSTWLYRVAVNHALMYMRRPAVRRNFLVWERADSQELQDALCERSLALENIALRDAINRLPTGYRRAILLVDIDGYTYDQAAVIMGISVGTVKSQRHKAKRKLQEMIWHVAVR